jgi:hypothetical protein
MGNSLRFRSALVAFVLLAAAVTAFGQSDRTRSDLAASFSKFDVGRVKSSSAANGRVSLSFTLGGSRVELSLEPHDMRAVRYRAQNTGEEGDTVSDRVPVSTFKGIVSGEEGSEARFNFRNSQVEGYFTSGGDRFFVEPASNYSKYAANGEYVIYRMEDALIDQSFGCTSKLGEKIGYGQEITRSAVSNAILGTKRVEIATDADLEYVNALGGPAAANAEILGILNVTEGLYTNQLLLSLSVVFQHTWSTGDPFAGANPEGIVRSFQAYWNANYPLTTMPRDTAHLFTGKTQALSQGWAFIGVICRDQASAYGLSGYISWAPGKYLITSHEIGHNLGANHVDTPQNCGNTLMNAQLSGSTPLSFCTYSQDEINGYLGSNGSCITPGSNCRFDFDGDAKADISVFRPSTGAWYMSRSTAGYIGFQFGQAGDKAVAADYDGDGMADAAVYRSGVWYILKSSTNAFDGVSFGNATDIPAPADFDGDGKADVAVFRPSTGIWYQLLSSNGAFNAVQFGQSGDVPVPADYDGDGKADINVFRPSNGVWYRVKSQTNAFYAVQFGATGDKPVAGDFDGDGRADTAVFRPAAGTWYILRLDNSYYGTGFGSNGDIPVAADYDGDGKTDISVYRPSTGTWYRLDSSTGGFVAFSFGISTDAPAPSLYMP